jgi:hypothetical protein
VSEQPPPSAPHGWAGIVDRVLSWTDTPWKAVALFLLIVAGAVGWTLWDKRDELLEAWLTPSAAALKTADVPQTLERLVEDSGADLVQVWSIDLSANSQRFVAARRRDGTRGVIPEPRRLPVIVTTSDAKALVDVIAGNPVCVDLTAQGSPLARRLADRGMRRGCAVPIPPDPSTFVGVIYLAWEWPPDASAEDVAVTAAREIAGGLVQR